MPLDILELQKRPIYTDEVFSHLPHAGIPGCFTWTFGVFEVRSGGYPERGRASQLQEKGVLLGPGLCYFFGVMG